MSLPFPPVEPPPTGWRFGPAERWDAEDDLVGAGADLEPGTVLEAYRHGVFPMPLGGRRDPLGWWSPVARGVLRPGGLRVSRSLRRSARDYEIRVDTAFEEVLVACADPRRPGGWIDTRIREAYGRLHRAGWVHSVEAWREGRLAGGLYGVGLGGLFAGESMFHRERDASKVALLGLVDLLTRERGEEWLVDVQWVTPHLASLGVEEAARSAYLRALPGLVGAPPVRWSAPPGPAGGVAGGVSGPERRLAEG